MWVTSKGFVGPSRAWTSCRSPGCFLCPLLRGSFRVLGCDCNTAPFSLLPATCASYLWAVLFGACVFVAVTYLGRIDLYSAYNALLCLCTARTEPVCWLMAVWPPHSHYRSREKPFPPPYFQPSCAFAPERASCGLHL